MRGRRVRLGFYMHPPMLGGAERYLRDLVWGVPRDRFDPYVIYPPWDAFERFLGLGREAAPHRIRVRTIEVGRRRGVGGQSPGVTTRVSSGMTPRLKQRLYVYARYGLWAWNYPLLRHALGRLGLDVVHVVNGGYPGAASGQAAVLAARHAGVRACVMTVASTPMERWRPRAVEAAIDRAVAGAVDAFVVPTAAAADVLAARRLMPAAACRIIPWGPHVPDVPPATEERRARLRAAFGLPPGVPIVVIVANFQPTKGHATLVEALARLRRAGMPVGGLFVGDGPARLDIERKVAAAGLRDAIVFTGRLPDPGGGGGPHLYEALQAADVFALPSEVEGLPYSVLEAMSQGLPVVATNVGSIPDAVVQGTTGLLVDPGDVDGLADALRGLLEDEQRLVAMGEAGRRRRAERFAPSVMIGRLVELYDELLASPQWTSA